MGPKKPIINEKKINVSYDEHGSVWLKKTWWKSEDKEKTIEWNCSIVILKHLGRGAVMSYIHNVPPEVWGLFVKERGKKDER